MTNREEKVEVSDARVVEEIKKAEEKEDDIYLGLGQLIPMDTDEESVEKEQEDSGISRKEKLKTLSYTLHNLEEDLMKKLLEIWNPCSTNFEDLEDGRKERKKKRKLDVDQGEGSGIKQKSEKDAQDSPVSDESDIRFFRALELAGLVMVEYRNYMDYISQMAAERMKNEDDWINHFERGAQVLEKLTDRIKKVIHEMEPMKKNKNQMEDYFKIHQILYELVRINARLIGSPNIAIASHRDCSDSDFAVCAQQLKQFKNDLYELMVRILNLKREKSSLAGKMCPNCNSENLGN